MRGHLLRFEYKKLFYQRKNILFLSSICLMALLFLALNYQMEKSRISDEINSIKFSIEESERVTNEIPRLLEGRSTSEIQMALESEQQERALLETKLYALQSANWRESLNAQLLLDKNLVHNIESGTIVGGEPLSFINQRISLNNEFIKTNISPEDPVYSTRGANFTNSIFSYLFSYIGIILILFFVGDRVTREFENGTIKLLFTLPISRAQILHSKIIISTVSSVFLFIFIGTISFISASFISGTGTFNYPILLHSSNHTINFINIKTLLLLSGLLFIFIIFFIILFVFLLSIMIKNSVITIGITMMTIGAYYFGLENFTFLNTFAHLIPFTYINAPSIIDGSLAHSLNNVNINLTMGIIVTLLSSIIIYVLSIYVINKKDIA